MAKSPLPGILPSEQPELESEESKRFRGAGRNFYVHSPPVTLPFVWPTTNVHHATAPNLSPWPTEPPTTTIGPSYLPPYIPPWLYQGYQNGYASMASAYSVDGKDYSLLFQQPTLHGSQPQIPRQDPSTTYRIQPSMEGDPVLSDQEHARIVSSRPKPQCWEHGCNGRQFSTFSNLLRHQREKSGQAAKVTCPKCGATFTRTTARNSHLLYKKCKT
ncbi:hypothetical protein LZ30DRAFT_593587 [Colletotrichum cereale]|nr:hypothetical protein LZ30DRAFT_593587 [Colletotrichum cereale]